MRHQLISEVDRCFDDCLDNMRSAIDDAAPEDTAEDIKRVVAAELDRLHIAVIGHIIATT